MNRFLIVFSVTFLVASGVLVVVLAQNGYDPLAPKGAIIWLWLAVVLVALYVAWRIDGILKRRGGVLGDGTNSGTRTGFLTPKPSAAQAAREARVEARRKKLIAEGKLEAEPEPEPEPESEGDAAPVRVSQSAPIKDRMAARAERVRRAKEQGKL